MNGLPVRVRDRALKQASMALCAELGGIEAAASLIERGKSVVGRWVNANDDDHWLGVRDLAALEALAGEPLVTMLLCRLAGGVFAPLPEAGGVAGDLPQLVMRLGAEFGDVASSVSKALGDGHFSAKEAEKVLRELADMDRLSAQLAQACRARIKQGDR